MGVAPQTPTARGSFREQDPCAFLECRIAGCCGNKLGEFFNDGELLRSVKRPLIGQDLHTHIVAVPIHVRCCTLWQIMHKCGSVLFEHWNIWYGFDCFHGGCGVSGEFMWIAKGSG